MKNVLKYIFKDWKIYDIVVLSLYIIGAIIVSVKLILPVMPIIAGLLLVLGIIYLTKKTLLGYIMALIGFGFACWYLFSFVLLGDFISTLAFIVPLVVWNIVKLFIHPKESSDKFDKWDYLTLFGSLFVISYPTYLMLVQFGSNFAIFQTVSLMIMFTITFLQVKNIEWSKFLYIIVTALQITVFVLQIVEKEFSIITFAFALLMSMILQICYLIKYLKNIRKNKIKNKNN